MKKIKINPTEPRYVLRAIAAPNKDMDNQDFQILIQLGDEFYEACPNKIQLDVGLSDKITMQMEVDLHDMIIDMPATMIDEDDNITKARFRVVGKNPFTGQHALNSSSDIEECTADGKDIFAQSFVLEADGETDGNNLIVHTLLPKSPK